MNAGPISRFKDEKRMVVRSLKGLGILEYNLAFSLSSINEFMSDCLSSSSPITDLV